MKLTYFLQTITFVALIAGRAVSAAAPSTITAVCDIKAGSGSSETVQGSILLSEKFAADKSSVLTVTVKLSGFNATDDIKMHGFHVHVNGNTSVKCAAAGSHYNVDASSHGAPFNDVGKKHIGDFGNLNETNSAGTIEASITIDFASLVGTNGIANRSLVIHEKADDLGLGDAPTSNTTGNSGSRLGCCVINLKPSSLAGSSATSLAFSIITLAFSVFAVFLFDVQPF